MTQEIPRVPIASDGASPDDRDTSDAVTLRWTPTGRAERKLVFIPRASAGANWERIEMVRTDDGTWRPVGSEMVTDVAVVTAEDGRQ